MALGSDEGHRRRYQGSKADSVGVGQVQNNWSHLSLQVPEGQGSPLGQELLVTDEGVSTLFTGLGPVLIAKGLQLGLHGVEDRMVLVHRFLATPES